MKASPAPDPADIILGTAERPYPFPQYRLTPSDQAHHALVWGTTGTGKSRFLQTLFLQHVNKGQGVCLIDPHSDLAQGCLAALANLGFFDLPDAYERLVYVDFTTKSSVPFNVLTAPYEPHTTALCALEALVRTWPDLQDAPLFRTLFLSAALTLIANRLPLTEINRLLVDKDFRDECLTLVDDPLVLHTFAAHLDKGGATQAGSTLRRSFLLSFSPAIRGCLGQLDNALDFGRLMQEGVALIVNLGTVPDPITRRLLGSLILVQLEQAALARAELPPAARRPFTVMVDEWPSFGATTGETLQNVLEQTRKYQLRLYLAAQSLAQVDSSRLAGAFENCRLSVTFRLGYDSARVQAKYLADASPRPMTPAGGQLSRSQHVEGWAETLATLPNRKAFVAIPPAQPVRITTLHVPDPQLPQGTLEGIIDEYRRRYQRPTSPPPLPPVPTRPSDILDPDTYADAATELDFGAFFGESDTDAQVLPD